MGGLLPSFGKTESKGFVTINNGGDYYVTTSKNGEKIFHLFSLSSSGSSFRGVELTAYCNYTTIKCILLMHGDLNSLTLNVNKLGKNGNQMFRLKNIDGNIYIETESDTSLLEMRVKPLFGFLLSQIVMNVTNDIDLSSAKLLAEF